MKTYFWRAGSALLPLCLACPALADEKPSSSTDDPPGETIVVTPVSLHPAAGLMNEHTHDGGEFMLGLRYTHSGHSGANRSGTGPISDTDILAAGYTARASRMAMDMVMLDIMFAPNDKITLMVMPHWMRHEMTMVGIDPGNTGTMDMGGMEPTDHPHHSLAFGQEMTHSAQGFGDTLLSGSYRLLNRADLKAHATLGLWLPTGKVDRKNADGTFVHYMMQSGSGTYDIEPSVTVAGENGALGWGAQASYRWRTSDHNDSGFAFGDQAKATGWLSYRLSPSFSATSRLSWEHEGQIEGHYNGAHNHAAPPDRQGNYGGDTVLASIGGNIALPLPGRNRPQLGAEVGIPLYQNLNGIQLAEDWRLSVSVFQTF